MEIVLLSAIGPILLVVLLVVPLWRICGRAGFHPALSLIALFPVVGFLIVAAILGFVKWPAYNRGAEV